MYFWLKYHREQRKAMNVGMGRFSQVRERRLVLQELGESFCWYNDFQGELNKYCFGRCLEDKNGI